VRSFSHSGVEWRLTNEPFLCQIASFSMTRRFSDSSQAQPSPVVSLSHALLAWSANRAWPKAF
jgi:hypothetical protein